MNRFFLLFFDFFGDFAEPDFSDELSLLEAFLLIASTVKTCSDDVAVASELTVCAWFIGVASMLTVCAGFFGAPKQINAFYGIAASFCFFNAGSFWLCL